jgi:hypothetical protein
MRRCDHPEGKYPLYDAQGIFIAYVCDRCEDTVRARYRPEIFAGYSQADVDEPIDGD